jgi:hypothetical protein
VLKPTNLTKFKIMSLYIISLRFYWFYRSMHTKYLRDFYDFVQLTSRWTVPLRSARKRKSDFLELDCIEPNIDSVSDKDRENFIFAKF